MFRVHLRRKKLSNGQFSLYLDFSRKVWHAAKNKWTRRDFLDLYIHEKPRTKLETRHNSETLALANQRQAETLLAIKNGTYGIKAMVDADFLDFYRERAATRKEGTRKAWQSAYKCLADYTEGECRMSDISRTFLFDLKDYLDDLPMTDNTKRLYFSKVLTTVKEAHERNLLPRITVPNFSTTKGSRPFLTDDQVLRLQETPYPAIPDLKRAALFSILTSLRWSDILPLQYGQIQYNPEMEYFIDFKQKKVDCPEILYLNKEVLEVCEYEKGKRGRIFKLKYHEKTKLIEWFDLAGIPKPKGIEFHIFRHTFAIRAINRGEDIAVISAMMGHSDIKTTQQYARLLGKTKKTASDRITLK
jgi:integrase